MPSHRVLSLILLSACATTGTLGGDRESSPRARVQLAPITADETVRLVPQAIAPLLPSADRMSHVIHARLGDEASVDVRYCVSPAGKVTSAELVRSSSMGAFVVIGEVPEADEEQPCGDGKVYYLLGCPEVGLDGTDSRHGSSSVSLGCRLSA